MRKIKIAIIAVLLATLVPVAAFAASNWDDSLYRVNDYANKLTKTQIDELDEIAYGNVEKLQFDFPVAVVDNYSASSLSEFAKDFYKNNKYGYGTSKTGIMLALDTNKGEAYVYRSGNAGSVFSNDRVSRLEETAEAYLSKTDAYTTVKEYLNDVVSDVKLYRDDASPITSGISKPDWYPANTSTFKEFHNDSAPRVVDTADIFTDAEEKELAEKVADMRNRLNMDFVVFTDVSSYGLSRGVYAADFYTYNGYGVGDGYDGLVFFVCMEKGNRGWFTAAHGAARNLITESNLNHIDDSIESLMVDGKYGEATMTYLDQMDSLFTNGRLMPGLNTYLLCLVVAILIGLIIGVYSVSIKKRKMVTIQTAVQASNYLPSDGLQLQVQTDEFTGSTYVRTKRVQDDHHGGGGHGGSSFSGGFSGSSGGGFSGGGRSF